MDTQHGNETGRFGHRDDTGVAGSLASIATWLGDLTDLPQGRDDLTAVVAAAQAVVNAAAAVQDGAIARLAAIESEWAEDGTLVEVVKAPGHVAIDAADLIAPCVGLSHSQAQRRVEHAVRVAAGRIPVDDGSRPARVVPQESGLGGLHDAMRQGRLDHHRAAVVTHELATAPADVAAAVIAALDPHLERTPAPALRARCRRLLARISPDLLRRRADQARRDTGLRRWVSEPGVDTWYGTFPSEDAAAAWAAIDDLARHHVTNGVCATLEQARGKALTDLVTAQATVTVTLVLTHPADTTAAETTHADPAREDQSAVDDRPVPTAHDRDTVTASASPAQSVPAHDAVREGSTTSTGQTHSLGRRGEDLVEVRGLRPSEPALVSRDWLDQLTTGGADRVSVHVTDATCHPTTGALLTEPGTRTRGGSRTRTGAEAGTGDGRQVGSGVYRPPAWMVALVKTRDGRCRFPGCSVAARFCDLDHLRPWPLGPTDPDNLACLCRRHHRIKQRPGWKVRMSPGAVLEWTDPTGQVTTTQPLDALHGLLLPPLDHHPDSVNAVSVQLTEQPFSRLDFDLEHLTATIPTTVLAQTWTRPGRPPLVELNHVGERRGTHLDPATLTRGPHHRTRTQTRTPHPGHRARHADQASERWPDVPPF